MKAKVRNVFAKLIINGKGWSVVSCLLTDMCYLLREKELQRGMDEFYSVFTRTKLKVNAGKSKVFERREVEVVDFHTPYRVNVPTVGRCEVVVGEKIEEVLEFKYLETVLEFKYLGTVLCMHGRD